MKSRMLFIVFLSASVYLFGKIAVIDKTDIDIADIDMAVNDKNVVDETAIEESITGKSFSDKTVIEKSVIDKTVTGKSFSDKTLIDKTSPTKSASAKSATQKQVSSPGTAIIQRPNIIFILTDDMGFGDLSCYNGRYRTPNLDRMAREGIRFTSYYSAAPVCSPSRAGFLTGQSPVRWKINNYLSDKKHNRDCEQNDFLDPSAPSIAKVFKEAGYATGHFGKWHMGGGRDVTNPPHIAEYGFDAWNSTWESPDPDPLLTSSNWIWADTDSIKRWDRTAYFVDKTLDFLKNNKGTPCYINLWPDDVHTPWVPGGDYVKNEGNAEPNFEKVLKDYDIQIGRLLDSLKASGLDKNTIVVFTSDNGPAPNFRRDRSAGMRGAKLSLYEAGTRMPFIIWSPANLKGGIVDSGSVVTATDLMNSFAALAGIKADPKSDGEDRSAVLLGKPSPRKKEIYWEYGRNEIGFDYPKIPQGRSPGLAVRDGKWKLLMNYDGSGVELYNIDVDRNEANNLAGAEKTIAAALKKKLGEWWSVARTSDSGRKTR